MKPANAAVNTWYSLADWQTISSDFTAQFCTPMKGGGLRFESPRAPDGRAFLVHLNSEVHGAYGPSQKVQFRGYLLTVWAKEGLASVYESFERFEAMFAEASRAMAGSISSNRSNDS